jgi:lipoprotein-anchoring transpeptidase ErfK/SrfK
MKEQLICSLLSNLVYLLQCKSTSNKKRLLMVSGTNMSDKTTDQLKQAEIVQKATKLPSSRAKKKSHSSIEPNSFFEKCKRNWIKIVGFAVGSSALIAIIIAGSLGQYYKDKTLPNIRVAGQESGSMNKQALKESLQNRQKALKVSFTVGEKKLRPKEQEIGLKFDTEATVKSAFNAKRQEGFFTRIAYWRHRDVAAHVSLNDSLLKQYIESNTPELQKAPTDAQLQFDGASSQFIISKQADGESPDIAKVKSIILSASQDLSAKQVPVSVAKQGPKITEEKLQPLLVPANGLVSRSIVLRGAGQTFRAKPADIAEWMTPTPQEDGSMKLIIDPGKIQSYVEKIGKKVSKSPQDRKIIQDATAGTEVVLQEGVDGTELAGKQALTDSIATALKLEKDVSQELEVQTAAHKVVNMSSYDKWIEIDLSEQRTTAYEKATPIKNYLIASGMKGHETVQGEFAIWHKTKSQTMSGGSKADGSYYNIDNVQWVSYFYEDYALHGAWWRKQFGYPASHGCVNMTNADAQWIFEWAPMGTKVIVHA